jgi:alpha-ketoglutarate-dependent 2,4-dichlorophenoxyacetate dioxygenase
VVCEISNIDAGEVVADAEDLRVLRHGANRQWHTVSTFFPVPALADIVRADLLPLRGGETEFVSTRNAWRELPDSLRARVSDPVFRHRYTHSVGKVSALLAAQPICR